MSCASGASASIAVKKSTFYFYNTFSNFTFKLKFIGHTESHVSIKKQTP